MNSFRRFLLNMLSPQQKIAIKHQIYKFHIYFNKFFAKFSFLSAMYFLLFDRSFRREQLAVMSGRQRFELQRRMPKGSNAMLRRNIHRLEKGLMMTPRKPVFAEDYIGETVAVYVKACVDEGFSRSELQWANDVLSQYFAVVKQTTTIESALREYQQSSLATSSNCVPFPYGELPPHSCQYEQFLSLCTHRHSVRWFKPVPVDPGMIGKAILAAAQAPSACNRQPYKFHLLYQDKAAEAASLAMGTVGFAENIPALAVVVGDLSCYQEYRDRHLIYIDASLAAMQFMLALEALGLASCPINWPDIESREQSMQKLLALPVYHRPVMLIAIGYAAPTALVAYSQKKELEQLVSD